MQLKPYRHKTQYYETDTMKIVHHSNYVRWMEEARCDFLEQIGLGYDVMERAGMWVVSPLVIFVQGSRFMSRPSAVR